MNHYVANPFTIHQRLYIYIYISLYIACHDISHRITRITRREKPPLTIQHTERTLTHRVTYRGTCLSFLQRMYMTHRMIVPTSDSLSSLFDPSSSVHTLALFFFHVDFPDTIR